MVDIKHPLRKLLSQEMIDELQDNYEKNQKAKREANFQAKINVKIESEKLKASGHARIIITKNPREPDPIIEEHPIEVKVKDDKKEIIAEIETSELLKEHAMAAADHATEKIEAAMLSVEGIMANHKDWIDKYEENTGNKAIWKGVITAGFKDFIELNGLE